MRVLWWTFDFWPSLGGGAVIGSELARGLHSRGHQLFVVTQDPSDGSPERDTYDGIPVARLPFHRALQDNDIALIRAIDEELTDIVDSFGPDLVHLHTLAYPAFFCRRAISGSDVPLLVTRHELFAGPPETDSIAARVLDEADWVACCSKAALQDITSWSPAHSARSSVILNGLRPPEAEPGPVPAGPPQLLCLGRLTEQKGFDLAIEALPQIRERHPDARLRIVGRGPELDPLSELAERLGLADSVGFTGALSPNRIPAAMESAAIVVVPSRSGEAFGLVALEAAQAARPVVAARTGGLPEVVAEGETGLLFEPENSRNLEQAICTLLSDRLLADRLGRAARDRALRAFSGERYLDEYDVLYRRLGT